ncbi:acyl-CoA thioesterase II [Wolffia australiana]
MQLQEPELGDACWDLNSEISQIIVAAAGFASRTRSFWKRRLREHRRTAETALECSFTTSNQAFCIAWTNRVASSSRSLLLKVSGYSQYVVRLIMDTEEVEFLGQVPLLLKLPSSSLRKIAATVKVREYEPGEYIIREGQEADGIYFIWKGEAEVFRFVDSEEGSYLLKQFDYFGYGIGIVMDEVNIVALSKLICLVLPKEHFNLLQPSSIWNADETSDSYSVVEYVLRIEPIEVNLFRGYTVPRAPVFKQVFGGQFIGQALAAATKTVDCLKKVHNLHAYFIISGDRNVPTVYQVHHLRDGKSFAIRRVDATQKGTVVFSLLASFQKEESSFEHQEAKMPEVPHPDNLLSLEDLRDRKLTDPRIPISYRKHEAKNDFVPMPIEMRFCISSDMVGKYRFEPTLMYWFRVRGKLSDDPALHRCAIAYASDLLFLSVSLNPHRKKGMNIMCLSLNHSMWFHRDCRADEWLLFVIDSPSAAHGRGFTTGRMFNMKGELVVSLSQEGLVRKLVTPANPIPPSKL